MVVCVAGGVFFSAFFICGSYRVHISMIKRGSQRKRYSRAIAEPKTKKKVMGEGVREEGGKKCRLCEGL